MSYDKHDNNCEIYFISFMIESVISKVYCETIELYYEVETVST